MIQVFIDLDQTLADFDGHYERCFGVRPDKAADNVDWLKVRAMPGFYANIPLMPDAMVLWDFVKRLKPHPIILTGVPSLVPAAAADKRIMVARRFGEAADVICCPSKLKSAYMKPGDIIVDDWAKYRDLWLAAGGRWILHTSAEKSIQQLLDMGIGL